MLQFSTSRKKRLLLWRDAQFNKRLLPTLRLWSFISFELSHLTRLDYLNYKIHFWIKPVLVLMFSTCAIHKLRVGTSGSMSSTLVSNGHIAYPSAWRRLTRLKVLSLIVIWGRTAENVSMCSFSSRLLCAARWQLDNIMLHMWPSAASVACNKRGAQAS